MKAWGKTEARRVLNAALLSALGLALCLGCGRPMEAESPRDALDRYAEALAAGDAEAAYQELSDEAKQGLPYEAFARMVKDNPGETREIAESLLLPTAPPRVVANVTTPSGDALTLIYEHGRWQIDASAIDLYNQSTPEASVRSFVRALANRRYDVLLRFVPDSQRAGLSAAKLKKEWEGDQREEMERIVSGLEAALKFGEIEIFGDRAALAYGAGGTLELVREHAVWKIEEFR